MKLVLALILGLALSACEVHTYRTHPDRSPQHDPPVYQDAPPEAVHEDPPLPRYAASYSKMLKYNPAVPECYGKMIEVLRASGWRIGETQSRGEDRRWVVGFLDGSDSLVRVSWNRHSHKSQTTIVVCSNHLTEYECRESALHLHTQLGTALGEQGY